MSPAGNSTQQDPSGGEMVSYEKLMALFMIFADSTDEAERIRRLTEVLSKRVRCYFCGKVVKAEDAWVPEGGLTCPLCQEVWAKLV